MLSCDSMRASVWYPSMLSPWIASGLYTTGQSRFWCAAQRQFQRPFLHDLSIGLNPFSANVKVEGLCLGLTIWRIERWPWSFARILLESFDSRGKHRRLRYIVFASTGFYIVVAWPWSCRPPLARFVLGSLLETTGTQCTVARKLLMPVLESLRGPIVTRSGNLLLRPCYRLHKILQCFHGLGHFGCIDR